MKTVAPLIGAGVTFATTVIVGLLVGIWLMHRTGAQYWVLAGLFGGLILGGWSAFRLVSRSFSA